MGMSTFSFIVCFTLQGLVNGLLSKGLGTGFRSRAGGADREGFLLCCVKAGTHLLCRW